MRASFLTDKEPFNNTEEKRNKEDRKERSDEHPTENSRSNGFLRTRSGTAGNRERHDSKTKGERRHQNRTQSVANRGNRRLKQTHPVLQIDLRKLHDQNRVFTRQTDRRQHRNLEIDIALHSTKRTRQHCPDHPERRSQKNSCRNRPTLIQCSERQKDDQQRERIQHTRLPASLTFLIRSRRPLDSKSGRQFLHEALNLQHRSAGTDSGYSFTLNLDRRDAVVSLQSGRSIIPAGRPKRRKSHHLPCRITSRPISDVLRLPSAWSLRLNITPLDPSSFAKVVDIKSAPGDPERPIDLIHRQTTRRSFLVIDLHPQLRCIVESVWPGVRQQRTLSCETEKLIPGIHQSFVTMPRIVLKEKGETSRRPQFRNRRRNNCINQSVVNRTESSCCTFRQGRYTLRWIFSLAPILERNKGHPVTLTDSSKTKSLNRKYIGDQIALLFEKILLHFLDHLHGPLLTRTDRSLDQDKEVPLVLIRQKGRRQPEEKKHHQGHDHQEGSERTLSPSDDPAHDSLIFFVSTIKSAVKPSEKALLLPIFPFRSLLQHRRAKRRRKNNRHDHRQADSRNHRRRKLPVNNTGRPAKESHRNIDGRKNDTDPDQRARDLIHRFPRRFQRRKPFLVHHTFNVLNHDNRIIDQQTDRKDHRKHRQHVNREPERR